METDIIFITFHQTNFCKDNLRIKSFFYIFHKHKVAYGGFRLGSFPDYSVYSFRQAGVVNRFGNTIVSLYTKGVQGTFSIPGYQKPRRAGMNGLNQGEE